MIERYYKSKSIKMEYNKLNKTAWRKLIILFFYFFISFQFVQAQEQSECEVWKN